MIRWLAATCALGLLAAGCGGSHPAAIAPEQPPSPLGWPAYPRFSSHSCWTRPLGSGVMRSAPSFPPAPGAEPPRPGEVVRRLLARFGDRRFVRRIEIGPPPRVTLSHLRAYFAGVHPPADALWAYIAAPKATAMLPARATPEQVGAQMLAEWETALVEGALRDDFCAASGAPLIGWSLSRHVQGVSDRPQALGQRFPNPSPAAVRSRAAAIGERYGFRVVSLRLLRPRELAPLLVVETDRDRKAFVREVAAMMRLLDPIASAGQRTAVTFEGFFLEARDRKGPFVRVDNVYRGQVMGGQWSWDRCVYPYPHSEPFGAKPCPKGSS